MQPLSILVLSGAALAFAMVSGRLRGLPITAPMVMVAVGALLSGHALDVLRLEVEPALMHHLAEFTLIFLLFADASKVDAKALRHRAGLPIRLLAVGMPLTILLGVLLGSFVFPAWPIASVLVLAALLTPTDAALGQAIVEDERLPESMRRGLGVESGLNDGIAVPVVMVGIAVASMRAGPDASPWIKFALLQVVLGPLVGAGIGYLGGKALQTAEAHNTVDGAWQAIAGLAMAALAYAMAEQVGGNGFIAVFVAGLVIGNTAPLACGKLHRFVENEGQLLMFLVFVLFGCIYVFEIIETATVSMLVFAVLALTVMRMVPVLISLSASGHSWSEKILVAWFGPRGVASIVFAIIALESEHLPMRQEIFTVAMLTVLLSVFAHGATASPAASLYARFSSSSAQEKT